MIKYLFCKVKATNLVNDGSLNRARQCVNEIEFAKQV